MKSLLITIMTLFSLMLMSGSAYSVDFDKGMEAYEKGDYKTAVAEWKPLAEQGDAAGQLFLGMMYHNGQGVLQDYKKAAKWYRFAAEQGSADGQFFLGTIYDNGDHGIIQDYYQAAKGFRHAAEQGLAGALYKLGYMYASGYGVLQDVKEAVSSNSSPSVILWTMPTVITECSNTTQSGFPRI